MPHQIENDILVSCDECITRIKELLKRQERFPINAFDSSPEVCRSTTLEFIVGSLYDSHHESWRAPKRIRAEITDQVSNHGQFTRQEIDDVFSSYSYETDDYSYEFIDENKSGSGPEGIFSLRKRGLRETKYRFPISFCDDRKYIGYCVMNPEVLTCPDCGLEVLNAPSNVTLSSRQDIACPRCSARRDDPFDTRGIIRYGYPPHHGNWSTQQPLFEFGGTDYFSVLHPHCSGNNNKPGLMKVNGVWVDDCGRVVLSFECETCGSRNALKPYTVDGRIALLNESASWKRVKSRISQFLSASESESFERKASLRWSHKKNELDLNMEYQVAEAICAFLVTRGGVLLIGQSDSKDIVGIDADIVSLPSKKKNGEGFLEHLAQVVSSRLGSDVAHLWRASIEMHDGVQLCLVDVEKANHPVFVKMDDGREVFVVRNGPRTEKLDGKAQHEYIKRRFEAPVLGRKSKRG